MSITHSTHEKKKPHIKPHCVPTSTWNEKEKKRTHVEMSADLYTTTTLLPCQPCEGFKSPHLVDQKLANDVTFQQSTLNQYVYMLILCTN